MKLCKAASFKLSALVTLTMLVSGCGADNSAELQNPWAELAVSDIAALRDVLAKNHPGAVDPERSDVSEWLDDGFATALEMGANANSYGGYFHAVKFFGDGFNDKHVGLSPLLTLRRARWPGFAVVVKGDKFVVIESEVDELPAGAVLLSCDGVHPEALYNEFVAPYHGVDGLKADKRQFVPFIFADYGNPFVDRPAVCTWEVDDGERVLSLNWSRIDYSVLSEKLYEVAFGETPAFAFIEWRQKAFWISTPSFAFTSDTAQLSDNVSNMEGILKNIRDRADDLRSADIVVFDVRGNNGGSGAWGVQMLNSIWGEGFATYLEKTRADFVDWRVSPENIAANERFLDTFRNAGAMDAVAYYEPLVEGMKQAALAGDDFYRSDDFTAEADQYEQRSVQPKIILLSNGTCFSACLDFADMVLSIEGAQLWGYDTSADSVYIENRGASLPSGLMHVSLPMKVWRGRFRGHNQPYKATHTFQGVFETTQAAQAWVDDQLSIEK